MCPLLQIGVFEIQRRGALEFPNFSHPVFLRLEFKTVRTISLEFVSSMSKNRNIKLTDEHLEVSQLLGYSEQDGLLR